MAESSAVKGEPPLMPRLRERLLGYLLVTHPLPSAIYVVATAERMGKRRKAQGPL